MILPLKTFMVKQNLQSWFLDTSPPSPQVASLLNKQLFLSYQHLSFEYWLLSGGQPNLSSVTIVDLPQPQSSQCQQSQMK